MNEFIGILILAAVVGALLGALIPNEAKK